MQSGKRSAGLIAPQRQLVSEPSRCLFGQIERSRDAWPKVIPDLIAVTSGNVPVADTSLPVSADLEKGFGDAPEIVAETIRLAAEAGLVGCTIEDATGNEDCPLYDERLAVERIAAAAQAARALQCSFIVTARTHNLLYAAPPAGRHHQPPSSLRRSRSRCAFRPRPA